MKLEPYHVYIQNLIQDGLGLNIRFETMKILEENRIQSIQNNLIYDTKLWQ